MYVLHNRFRWVHIWIWIQPFPFVYLNGLVSAVKAPQEIRKSGAGNQIHMLVAWRVERRPPSRTTVLKFLMPYISYIYYTKCHHLSTSWHAHWPPCPPRLGSKVSERFVAIFFSVSSFSHVMRHVLFPNDRRRKSHAWWSIPEAHFSCCRADRGVGMGMG